MFFNEENVISRIFLLYNSTKSEVIIYKNTLKNILTKINHFQLICITYN